MAKKLNTPKEIEICDFCNCQLPWHLKTCDLVKHKYCRECGARLPRHYPACSQDTINFSRWWIPEFNQKEVAEAYDLMVKEAKFNLTCREPPKIKPEREYPHEQNVNPIIGQRIMKAIFTMLECESREKMLVMKKAIHEEIDKRKGFE